MQIEVHMNAEKFPPLNTEKMNETSINITMTENKNEKANQILDPTWTTPVLKAKFVSQAGQD